MAAFESFFAQHERRVGQFLAQMVKSRSVAEDLLQDVFVNAFRARAALTGVTNAEAWLFAIARNRALAELRRQRRWYRFLDRLLSERLASTDHDPSEALAVRDLLMRCLAPEERALVILRYVHGFSSVELASMTGRSPDAVRQQLVRARKRVIAHADQRKSKEEV